MVKQDIPQVNIRRHSPCTSESTTIPNTAPARRWETDARLMQEAGFNVVRMAEFAWVFMEPEEGRFEFGWLDEALDILGRRRHPRHPRHAHRRHAGLAGAQVSRGAGDADKTGRRITWGVRKDNCFTAGAYRLLSERITRAMAEHYDQAPNVIGWQTDNEFGNPVCYCDTCRARLPRLAARPVRHARRAEPRLGHALLGPPLRRRGPRSRLPDNEGTHNPGLCLDWRRFYSWLNVRFQARPGAHPAPGVPAALRHPQFHGPVQRA